MATAPPPGGDLLQADLIIEYPFNRTTGPVIGAFFTGLINRRILGIRGVDGRVICPPVEYDPVTGESLTELVPVADAGVVESWTWVSTPRPTEPFDGPYALALIRLDGADTAMLHGVVAPAPDSVRTGSRVRARWADERTGAITDIVAFDLVEAPTSGGATR
ncbi:MAG: OB-fold domain-containing protein [Microthrixaceae bacterium]